MLEQIPLIDLKDVDPFLAASAECRHSVW
jgi:hypothetical protein